MSEQPVGLRIRKLADTSSGERVVRYHPETGERHLVNPATGQPESWPLAGVQIEGDVPTRATLSTTLVTDGVREGWITRVNERPVHKPGGPPEDKWRVTHTFLHADQIVMHLVDGDITWIVERQPDKHHAEGDHLEIDDGTYAAGNTVVDWHYVVRLLEA